MRSPNDGESLIKSIRDKLLSSSHINEIHFSLRIYHRIFRFQIPINNIINVKILNTQKQASKVIPHHIIIHRFHLPDHIKHLFPMNIFHDQINVLFVMKGFDITNDIRKYNLL